MLKITNICKMNKINLLFVSENGIEFIFILKKLFFFLNSFTHSIIQPFAQINNHLSVIPFLPSTLAPGLHSFNHSLSRARARGYNIFINSKKSKACVCLSFCFVFEIKTTIVTVTNNNNNNKHQSTTKTMKTMKK